MSLNPSIVRRELRAFSLAFFYGFWLAVLLCLMAWLAAFIVGAAHMTPELFDSGLPRTPTDELVDLYRTAQTSLRKVVLNPPGGTEASQASRQAWASAQIVQVDRELAKLGHASDLWIGKNLPTPFIDGVTRANQQAVNAGIVQKGAITQQGSFAQIDHGTLKIFAQEIHTDLGNAAKSAGDRAKYLLKTTAQEKLSEADINRILAGGVISGRPDETIRQLREQLRAVHGDQVTVKTKTGGTIDYEVGYYAGLVVRTRTREANVLSQHQRLQQLNIDLVAIVGKISNNFCTAFLGQVFSLSGKNTTYPPLASLPHGNGYQSPPFHPNCSKSTRAFNAALSTEKQLAQARPDADQAKMLNITPTQAQRRFKDLQLRAVVTGRYATTAKQLFGPQGGDKKSTSERPS